MKKTNREIPLYTRVSKINKAFVSEISIHAKSEAHFVDTILTYARNKMSRTQLKELLNGTKAGKRVSTKVSKASKITA